MPTRDHNTLTAGERQLLSGVLEDIKALAVQHGRTHHPTGRGPRRTTVVTNHELTAGERQLIGGVLEDIKALWDEAGVGEDAEVSEALYRRLEAAIRLCYKAPQP
jgi:hypothetical protein